MSSGHHCTLNTCITSWYISEFLLYRRNYLRVKTKLINIAITIKCTNASSTCCLPASPHTGNEMISTAHPSCVPRTSLHTPDTSPSRLPSLSSNIYATPMILFIFSMKLLCPSFFHPYFAYKIFSNSLNFCHFKVPSLLTLYLLLLIILHLHFFHGWPSPIRRSSITVRFSFPLTVYRPHYFLVMPIMCPDARLP